MMIDVNCPKEFCIINIFHQFNPPIKLTQIQHFAFQMQTTNEISRNLNGKKIIISGGFNIDDSKRHAVGYRYKNLFEKHNEIFYNLNPMQQINIPALQGVIYNEKRESMLDHI